MNFHFVFLFVSNLFSGCKGTHFSNTTEQSYKYFLKTVFNN